MKLLGYKHHMPSRYQEAKHLITGLISSINGETQKTNDKEKSQNIVKKIVKGIFLYSFHQIYRQWACSMTKVSLRQDIENFPLKMY